MEGFQVTYWRWWGAAVVLAVLEMMVPGAMLIWFGAAAAVIPFRIAPALRPNGAAEPVFAGHERKCGFVPGGRRIFQE